VQNSYFEGTTSNAGNYSANNIHEMEEMPNVPIRLQGKNGVLKVMLNKKNQFNFYNRLYEQQKYVNKNVGIEPSFFPDSRFSQESSSVAGTKKTEHSYVGKQAFFEPEKPYKSIKVEDTRIDYGDASMKMGLPPMQAYRPRIAVKREEKANLATEIVAPGTEIVAPVTEIGAPARGKEVKVKRGSGTEKQILREKIRSMLLSAGWKIDFRPRRNRDYLDAVYVNPAGTAYWSIIKAYEAYQKQLEEKNKETLLPEETLNKLTRQTRKKIEREMNKKRRDESFCEIAERKVENIESVQVRMSNKIGRSALYVRSSDGLVPYSGKRTILSWMIDCGVVKIGEKVQYMNRKKSRTMLEGWITRDGIHCGCCSKILTVSKFEIHAGSKERQPFQHVHLESGSSLVQCMVAAWNRQEGSGRRSYHVVDVDGDDHSDDTCGICSDGGDLICCDGCPSTFHKSCLGIQVLPQGDWHCANCRCKFCGTVGELYTCSHCEKKYHKSCDNRMNIVSVGSNTESSFCGATCQELFGQLQKLIGVKHELESGLSWSLIRRIGPSSDQSAIGLGQRVDCYSKLAVAQLVMDECFWPIRDRRSGINILHNVLYNCGSNLNRVNYNGFYTFILERGDEIISAASVRIHGTELAEMPFIGTRYIYRRQGMCRRLLSAIESVLCSVKVEKLMIPAIADHMNTWTDIFEFKPLEEVHKQEIRSINILVLPGIGMLQKKLVKQETPERNITATSDKSELDSSSGNVDMRDDDANSGSKFLKKEILSTGSESDENEDKNTDSD
jgi:hypothetical protein